MDDVLCSLDIAPQYHFTLIALVIYGGNERRHRAVLRCLQRRRLSTSEGGGVVFRLFAFDTGRGYRRARIFEFTAPRAERPGRGADRGYSFVSMIHHTARAKARPVMG